MIHYVSPQCITGINAFKIGFVSAELPADFTTEVKTLRLESMVQGRVDRVDHLNRGGI